MLGLHGLTLLLLQVELLLHVLLLLLGHVALVRLLRPPKEKRKQFRTVCGGFYRVLIFDLGFT